ncbi:MAG: 3-oxoacyl-[acyl-carrier-protein] reductase [Bacteroidales bacterium]|nr:3-oxoacyl-[acyl-carrier-protein] reductase [Bacteroidales bacterium]
MKLLEGKTAIVTGAARGIGRAIALTFGKHGADVAFTDLAIDDNVKSLEKELADMGVKGKGYVADASKFDASQELVKQIVEDFGKVDVLINNAGITRDTLLMRMTEEQWDLVINVNLKSAFNMTKAVIGTMMKQRSGSIVNMSSIVGVGGNASQANYSASKAGIIGLTKSLAKELGSRNIQVNAIAPGFIQTEMTKDLEGKVIEEMKIAIPLNRLGLPEDVANGALFLASHMSDYVTGTVLNVSGGLYM